MIAVNIVGISIVSLFVLFILQKRNKLISDYFLILNNVLLSLFLLSDIWIKQGLNTLNFILQKTISFYIFPVFFIYSLLLVSKTHKLKRNWLWFAAFAISFTVFIIVDFTVFHRYTPQDLQKLFTNPSLPYHFFYKSNKVFIAICLIWFLGVLRKYQQEIKENHSSIESIRLRWLKNFVWLYMIINIISFLIFIVFHSGFLPSIRQVFFILNISLVLSLFYLSFYGIRQYNVAEFYENKPTESSESSTRNDTTVAEKYSTSSLSYEGMKQLYHQLEEVFNNEKLYTEPQLQIQDVANKLDVTVYKVSQTINTMAQKNFYDFVNGYRVEYLKQLLIDPGNKQYTILALGIESGFNSKSSLNRVFKQFSGMSPREYQKTNHNL